MDASTTTEGLGMFETYFDILRVKPGFLAAIMFLTLSRLIPIISLAPFFGAKLMPQPARIGFALCLFAILLPHMLVTVKEPLDWNPALIGYALKEMGIGFILGFMVTMPFNIAQMAGIVIDNQRGSSSLTGSDPILSNQVSTIGMLYNFVTIVIFFSLNGPFLFLDAVVKSYNIIPIDQYPSIEFFTNTTGHFWTYIITLMGRIFALATQLAAPSLVAILMADVFLGIVNRLAPQIQISFLGMGLKAYSGDIALWAAWLFIVEQLGIMSINWIKGMNDLLDHLQI